MYQIQEQKKTSKVKKSEGKERYQYQLETSVTTDSLIFFFLLFSIDFFLCDF